MAEDAENYMGDATALLSDPAAWLALGTLIAMELVLGVDNLIFISIMTNKLPPRNVPKDDASELVWH